MALTNEQAQQIKEQIFKQLENFPEDKREDAKNHIESLNNEQLEEFIIKNNLIKNSSESGGENENSCIMCLISGKKIKSFSVYEDENYLAVLEINPLSEGHTILIPKKHIEKIKDIPKSSEEIIKKIEKHLIKKLNVKEVKITPSEEVGHAIINIIPVYDGKEIKNRKSAKPEELKKIKEKIGEIKEEREHKKEIEASKNLGSLGKEEKIEIKQKPAEIIKLLRRIP